MLSFQFWKMPVSAKAKPSKIRKDQLPPEDSPMLWKLVKTQPTRSWPLSESLPIGARMVFMPLGDVSSKFKSPRQVCVRLTSTSTAWTVSELGIVTEDVMPGPPSSGIGRFTLTVPEVMEVC